MAEVRLQMSVEVDFIIDRINELVHTSRVVDVRVLELKRDHVFRIFVQKRVREMNLVVVELVLVLLGKLAIDSNFFDSFTVEVEEEFIFGLLTQVERSHKFTLERIISSKSEEKVVFDVRNLIHSLFRLLFPEHDILGIKAFINVPFRDVFS